MLVLSRKLDEMIIVTGPDKTQMAIRVIEIRGDKVRLGFDAPATWMIQRHEIQEKIDQVAREKLKG